MNNKLITPKQFYNLINYENLTIIGVDKIYELVRRKDFPALKLGGRYYIIADKIDEWFNRQSEKFWC